MPVHLQDFRVDHDRSGKNRRGFALSLPDGELGIKRGRFLPCHSSKLTAVWKTLKKFLSYVREIRTKCRSCDESQARFYTIESSRRIECLSRIDSRLIFPHGFNGVRKKADYTFADDESHNLSARQREKICIFISDLSKLSKVCNLICSIKGIEII